MKGMDTREGHRCPLTRPWQACLNFLQREGRVSYRALRRRFDLDEEYREDLQAEIIQAKKLALDEDGAVLVPYQSSIDG